MVKQVGGRYRIWLEPEVHQARNTLPGSVRQRVKRAIEKLSSNPRIEGSKELAVGGDCTGRR